MGAVLSGVRRRSSLSPYMDNNKNTKMQNRPVAPVVPRHISPHVSSFERRTKFKKSLDTSKEDCSSFEGSQASESENVEKKKKKKEPSSHSSDTSYGVKSLPQISDYYRWRHDNKSEDEKWLGAVKEFNARQKVWKRRATPARCVRRIGCKPFGLNWTKCAKEVYKRVPPSLWVVEPDLQQEQQLRKYKRITEE
ncbi:hypothetical protein PMAYCL1PPCAC_18969, partial [Pristionchus mayeri]